MRGKATEEEVTGYDVRITPAGAGKSQDVCQSYQLLWDHPRGCGEKPVCIHSLTTKAGSPPRVRGKALRGDGERSGQGITPAGAGKSLSFVIFCGSSWDHPRGCGEKEEENENAEK